MVLAALAEPLREASLLAPVRVRLEGLSHFKNQVNEHCALLHVHGSAGGNVARGPTLRALPSMAVGSVVVVFLVRSSCLPPTAEQVLYLDVRPDDGLQQLMALAAAARAHFKDAGLLLQADQPFVPHGAPPGLGGRLCGQSYAR